MELDKHFQNGPDYYHYYSNCIQGARKTKSNNKSYKAILLVTRAVTLLNTLQ